MNIAKLQARESSFFKSGLIQSEIEEETKEPSKKDLLAVVNPNINNFEEDKSKNVIDTYLSVDFADLVSKDY